VNGDAGDDHATGVVLRRIDRAAHLPLHALIFSAPRCTRIGARHRLMARGATSGYNVSFEKPLVVGHDLARSLFF
jgi:hypothetical protein